MTDPHLYGLFALGVIGCVLGWYMVYRIVRATPWPMNTSKLHLSLAAGIGALLPFVPKLIALIPHLPAEVANALCALILAVAYSLVPKQAAPASKGDQAGFALKRALFELCALACVFALVACAALRNAEADPVGALQDAAHAYDKGRDTAVKACTDARKLVAAGILRGDKAKAVDVTCKPIEEAARVHVDVTIDAAPEGDAGSP